MNATIDRRGFLKLGASCIAVGFLSIGFDAVVNGGRPAEVAEVEPAETKDDDEDP